MSRLLPLLCLLGALGVDSTVLDVLRRHHDLYMFHDLVVKSPILLKTLEIREGTLFAPTNAAIKEYEGTIDNYTLLYHFNNVAKKVEDIVEDVISSELPGNPPIWVTRKSADELFLNDAKIDPVRKNFRATNQFGQEQMVHFIDRVLEPTFPTTLTSSLYNPDAARFIEQSSQYNITGKHQITDFAQQVAFQNRINTFRGSGRHTFFIPVDEAFKRITIKSVDAKVIDGHVIPNAVIFLRPAEIGSEYKTEAFASNLPVFVSFGKQRVNEQDEWIIKSDTRSSDGDQFHRRGVVQTEVVKGNIPLRNGVAHLISKPLVLIDSTVYQTLADDKDAGPMKEFFNLINEYASEEFKAVIQNPNPYGITIFVPTNEALQISKVDFLKANKTALEQVLRLHIILKTLTSDNITEGSRNEREPYQVASYDPTKMLYFNVVNPRGIHGHQANHGRRFYVEGGGSNATIIQTDIGATNGVIHMIDRVLGVSDQTLYEKLRTDPMLQKTFQLTSQENFNFKFNDLNGRFTLFAPSDAAWEKIYRTAPSEYKKLFMGEYGYHVGKIMERHMMVNQVFSIEELRYLSRNATEGMYPIPAVHGYLRVNHREDVDWRKLQRERNNAFQGQFANGIGGAPFAYDYAVSWNFVRAQVIRPNVECINGIIHVIDTVLMSPADVTVNGGDCLLPSNPASLVFTLLPLLSARLLLHSQ